VAGRSLVGDLWQFRTLVTDLDGDPIGDEVPTVTITPPSGAVAHPTASIVDGGEFRFTYSPTLPGRYVVTAATASFGLGAYGAWADATLTAAGMPVIADVELYIDDLSYDPDTITDALDAEAAAQRARLRPSALYTLDVRQALLRRVQRNLAMRRLPLATPQGDAESGAAFIPRTDPEIRRLEAPYRKMFVG
jgi:hypothetical protein